MARLNVPDRTPTTRGTTHEGAPAAAITPLQELRRSVLACLLWENEFYEGGQAIGERIAELVRSVGLTDPDAIVRLALEARNVMKLRHVPLLIAREAARHGNPALRSQTAVILNGIIQRPDELTEFLAVYWKDGKQPLSAQVKKGLARAFGKFNAYQLGKYNSDKSPIKLRDVLFLCHAKPRDGRRGFTKARRREIKAMDADTHDRTVPPLNEHEALYKRLVDQTLESPDTWEVALSGGADKREAFTRLMAERKLGGLALLRNLRNMQQANVDPTLIRTSIRAMVTDRILPFRFISAARYAPLFVDALDEAMLRSLQDLPRLPGTTVLLVDGSGSMETSISAKSEVTRLDCAAGLAVILRQICDSCAVYVFSNVMKQAPSYKGLALADALKHQVPAAGTLLGAAVRTLNTQPYDRLIVITDEQSHDAPPPPRGRGYVINVASAKPGIGYGPWVHIDGWSERVVDYIREVENTTAVEI